MITTTEKKIKKELQEKIENLNSQKWYYTNLSFCQQHFTLLENRIKVLTEELKDIYQNELKQI